MGQGGRLLDDRVSQAALDVCLSAVNLRPPTLGRVGVFTGLQGGAPATTAARAATTANLRETIVCDGCFLGVKPEAAWEMECSK